MSDPEYYEDEIETPDGDRILVAGIVADEDPDDKSVNYDEEGNIVRNMEPYDNQSASEIIGILNISIPEELANYNNPISYDEEGNPIQEIDSFFDPSESLLRDIYETLDGWEKTKLNYLSPILLDLPDKPKTDAEYKELLNLFECADIDWTLDLIHSTIDIVNLLIKEYGIKINYEDFVNIVKYITNILKCCLAYYDGYVEGYDIVNLVNRLRKKYKIKINYKDCINMFEDCCCTYQDTFSDHLGFDHLGVKIDIVELIKQYGIEINDENPIEVDRFLISNNLTEICDICDICENISMLNGKSYGPKTFDDVCEILKYGINDVKKSICLADSLCGSFNITFKDFIELLKLGGSTATIIQYFIDLGDKPENFWDLYNMLDTIEHTNIPYYDELGINTLMKYVKNRRIKTFEDFIKEYNESFRMMESGRTFREPELPKEVNLDPMDPGRQGFEKFENFIHIIRDYINNVSKKGNEKILSIEQYVEKVGALIGNEKRLEELLKYNELVDINNIEKLEGKQYAPQTLEEKLQVCSIEPEKLEKIIEIADKLSIESFKDIIKIYGRLGYSTVHIENYDKFEGKKYAPQTLEEKLHACSVEPTELEKAIETADKFGIESFEDFEEVYDSLQYSILEIKNIEKLAGKQYAPKTIDEKLHACSVEPTELEKIIEIVDKLSIESFEDFEKVYDKLQRSPLYVGNIDKLEGKPYAPQTLEEKLNACSKELEKLEKAIEVADKLSIESFEDFEEVYYGLLRNSTLYAENYDKFKGKQYAPQTSEEKLKACSMKPEKLEKAIEVADKLSIESFEDFEEVYNLIKEVWNKEYDSEIDRYQECNLEIDGKSIKVSLNYTRRRQKFIIAQDVNNEYYFCSEDLDFHREILNKFNTENSLKCGCIGGGRINIDDSKKTVTLYGESQDFGQVKWNEKLKTMLQQGINEQYPNYKDYTIIIN